MLRVAFLAGTLGQAGAEKQLMYMARSLSRCGAAVRVYSLTRGEHYDAEFARLGFAPQWLGPLRHPAPRLVRLASRLARFRPHVVHSAHAFTNLYAALAAPFGGAASIGSLRGDFPACRRDHGGWTRLLLRAPQGIVVNSRKALEEAVAAGFIRGEHAYYLPNVIDLEAVDGGRTKAAGWPAGHPGVVFACLGRLIPGKRVDVFLHALARARRYDGRIRGVVAGAGPERGRLEALAGLLGIAGAVRFLGHCTNTAPVLGQADAVVHCSQSEGFPNAILEAMAWRLPVLATPAGDTGSVLGDGGVLVPFGDADALASCMLDLAWSETRRARLGQAGRRRAEAFRASALGPSLLRIYEDVLARAGRKNSLEAFAVRP